MQKDPISWKLRLVPCPAYDLAGTEAWLEALAEEGLFLKKDGFFAGIGRFEVGAPRKTTYRLQPSLHGTGLFSAYQGEPDPESIALNEKYGWEYVAKRGQFYIYRATRPDAREMDTDPQVQASALRILQKRGHSAMLHMIFWGIVYPFLHLFNGFWLGMLEMRSWLFLLLGGIVLWEIADSFLEWWSLGRLQKVLRAGGVPPVKKRKLPYFWCVLARNVLFCVGILLFFGRICDPLFDDDAIPLKEYGENPPFATFLDIAQEKGGLTESYRLLEHGYGNDAEEWSDWIAPKNIRWQEIAGITLSDGSGLEGLFYADYHETRSPWLAEQVAKEYFRYDKRKAGKYFESIDVPKVDADRVWVYRNRIHTPCAVIQKGNLVLHVSFLQFSDDDPVATEEWVALLAESLG